MIKVILIEPKLIVYFMVVILVTFLEDCLVMYGYIVVVLATKYDIWLLIYNWQCY